MARTKQTARKGYSGGIAPRSAFQSAGASGTNLTSFNEFPEVPSRREKEGEDEEMEEDNGDMNDRENEANAKEKGSEDNDKDGGADEDQEEIKAEEDGTAFVGEKETPTTTEAGERTTSPASTIPTPTPAPGSQARDSAMTQTSTDSTDPATAKKKRKTEYTYIMSSERVVVQKHLKKFVQSTKAAQIAIQDRFAKLCELREKKLLEREKIGTVTTRTHKDPRSKKSKQEEEQWIRNQGCFAAYLKGDGSKAVAPTLDAGNKNVGENDQDDEEPVSAKKEVQEDEEMVDWTEAEANTASKPSQRTWQVRDGNLVVWPPFEDGANPERWMPRKRTGHWAAQEVVPVEHEGVKRKGECNCM